MRHKYPMKRVNPLVFWRIWACGFITMACAVLAAPPAHAQVAKWQKKAHTPGLSAFAKEAYHQIALLAGTNHYETTQYAGSGIAQTPGDPPCGFLVNWLENGSEKPAITLKKMGLPVVPYLAEALADTTPTAIQTCYWHGQPFRTWKVNELAARVLVDITVYEFAVKAMGKEDNEEDVDIRLNTYLLPDAIGAHPELIPAYQKMVREWFAANQNRTDTERHIADINDPYNGNRRSALLWLGSRTVREAEPILSRRLRKLLADYDSDDDNEANTMPLGEYADMAYALGQIGDKSDLPLVQRVCRFLLLRTKNDKFRVYSRGMIFTAFHARALLGDKDRAVQDLFALFVPVLRREKSDDEKELRESLQAAEKW